MAKKKSKKSIQRVANVGAKDATDTSRGWQSKTALWAILATLALTFVCGPIAPLGY